MQWKNESQKETVLKVSKCTIFGKYIMGLKDGMNKGDYMRRIFFIIAFIFTSVIVQAADFSTTNLIVTGKASIPNIQFVSSCPNVKNPSLSSCISSIGSTTTNLYLDAPSTLTGALIIPSNIQIIGSSKGTINTSGYALTINGPFEAGYYTVFSGSGTVTFSSISVKEAVPHWFGLKGDGTTDDASSITAAINSGVPVTFPTMTNIITKSTITISNTMVNFGGSTITYQGSVGTWAIIVNVGNANYRYGLKNLNLVSASTNTTTRTHGINIGGSNGIAENISVTGFTGVSLGMGSGAESYTSVSFPASQQCYYWGIKNIQISPTHGWGFVVKASNNSNRIDNVAFFPYNGFGSSPTRPSNCINEMVVAGGSNHFSHIDMEAAPSAEKLYITETANFNVFSGTTYIETNTSWATPPYPRVTALAQSSANTIRIRSPYAGVQTLNDLGTSNDFRVVPSFYINGSQEIPPQYSQNIIFNGDFVLGDYTGWTDFSTGNTLTTSANGGYLSGGSLTETVVGGRPFISQDISVVSKATVTGFFGQNITASAWIKTNISGVKITINGLAGQSSAVSDGSWHFISTTTMIPTTATYIQIQIKTDAGSFTGYVTISNVSAHIGNNPSMGGWKPHSPPMVTFIDGDTTPSVLFGSSFKIISTATTTITNFTNGISGQEITVLTTTANTGIKNNSTINTTTGSDKTYPANYVGKFIFDGTKWYEH